MVPRIISSVLALLLTFPQLTAESPDSPAFPDVEKAIPSSVKAAGAPRHQVFPGGIRMAISTLSPVVQAHVNQGLNHLHGGWEFEAARHFAIAMTKDPDCLMAHWGMLMALLSPNPETLEARNAVVARLIELVDQGKGTDLERGYAYGLLKYLEEGPSVAADAFRKVADKYPREMQAAVFSSLFRRTGYDELGSATPDQEEAEKHLLAEARTHPDSTVPIHALLVIRAEAPDLSASLELARKLCQMAPDYPPYHHLLGHYEWRTGSHREASTAFSKASSLYRVWMDNYKLTLADCPEWISSEAYRVVALASQGEKETAMAAARQLASIVLPDDRKSSPGARMLDWEGKSLPARLGHMLDTEASLHEALAALPSTTDTKLMRNRTLANWWIDGLRIALDGLVHVKKGDLEQARQVSQALTVFGESMARTQQESAQTGERTLWLRAFRSMEVLASQLRGEIAFAGPADKREIAYNWFVSAADRQLPDPAMLPPSILIPMRSKLGWFQLQSGRPADAVECFEESLQRHPNDPGTLEGLKNARQALQPQPVTPSYSAPSPTR